MATFQASAQPLSPDDPEMKAFAAGVISKHPGVPLSELLRWTGGVYKTESPLPPRFREDIRRVAELTGDSNLLAVAERGEVTIPFEHLRGLDPETLIMVRTELTYAPGESERLGLKHEGPFDPRKSVVVGEPDVGTTNTE